LVGLLVLAMVIMTMAFLAAISDKNEKYRRLSERYGQLSEAYRQYREAVAKPATASPPEDDDARAIRDYDAVARQYKAMVDELYDYGEQVAKRRRDPS
jgi:hypothetical protein